MTLHRERLRPFNFSSVAAMSRAADGTVMLSTILLALTRRKPARSSKLSRVPHIPVWLSMRARAIGILALALLAVTADRSFAAASAGCDGGGFSLLGLS